MAWFEFASIKHECTLHIKFIHVDKPWITFTYINKFELSMVDPPDPLQSPHCSRHVHANHPGSRIPPEPHTITAQTLSSLHSAARAQRGQSHSKGIHISCAARLCLCPPNRSTRARPLELLSKHFRNRITYRSKTAGCPGLAPVTCAQ